MALTKCSECNKEVSTLAETCPHCGAPINPAVIKDKMAKELVKVEVTKEKCSIITIFLFFIISFAMLIAFFIFDTKGYYLISTRGTEYALMNCLTNENLALYSWLFGGAIGLITFISFILIITSRKTSKIAKIGYFINLIIMSVFFVGAQSNDLRVGLQYWIIYGIDILLLLIPRLDKVITQNTLVSKKEIPKIEKANEKLEKLYSKKRINKVSITISSLLIIMIAIGTLIMFHINNQSYEPYEQKNPRNLNQLRVKTDYINVREKPSLNSDIIGKIYEDDIYNILDIINDYDDEYIWYKIEYKDEYAYIASRREEPYIKIIYSESIPKGYGTPNSDTERKLQKVLSKRNYIHSDSEQYSLYEDDQRTTIYLYNDMIERVVLKNDYELLMKYKYLNDIVEVKYQAMDAEINLIYDLKTEKYSCQFSSNCSNVINLAEQLVPQLIEEFNQYLKEANLTIKDFN